MAFEENNRYEYDSDVDNSEFQISNSEYYFINLIDKNAEILREPQQGYFDLLCAIFGEHYPITYLSVVENLEMYLEKAFDYILTLLNDMEREIIQKRYGLTDGVKRSLRCIGKDYDLTGERIRQIEKKALRKLRHPSRSRCIRKALYSPKYHKSTTKEYIDHIKYIEEIIRQEISHLKAHEDADFSDYLFGSVYVSPRFNDVIDDFSNAYFDEWDMFIDDTNINITKYPLEPDSFFANKDELAIINTDLPVNDMLWCFNYGFYFVSDYLKYYDLFMNRKGDNFPFILVDKRDILSKLIKYDVPVLRVRISHQACDFMQKSKIYSYEALLKNINSFPSELIDEVNSLISIIEENKSLILQENQV